MILVQNERNKQNLELRNYIIIIMVKFDEENKCRKTERERERE